MARLGHLFFPILLLAAHWLFIVAIRTFVGVELPDPTDLLPVAWRDLFPRRF
jgi:hypothetical protein